MRSPQTRLCQLSLFLLAAALGITTSTANAQITLDPAEPQAGEPFQVRIEGAWRDSCTPTDPRLRIADRLLEVTFRLSGSVCLLAGTSYTAVISVPALDAGTYELRARIFDFDGPKPFFQQTLSVQGSPGGIVSISPTFDTPVGNRVIVLRGSFPCETNDCAAPEVFFGERAAEAVERISESEIHAVAPAQNARVVDVIVQGTSYRRVRPSGFTYIGRTGEYERVMLPIFTDTPVPGAHGSLWRAEFQMVNLTGIELISGLDLFPLEPRCSSEPCRPPIAARQMVSPRLAAPRIDVSHPPVRLFYVRKDLAGLMSYSLRIRDLSRQAESWGTEIPVVREGDFATRVTLLDIPLQPRFRQHLRLYMPDYVGCCPAGVRFFSTTGEELLSMDIDAVRPNGALGGLVPPPYLREGSRELSLQPAYAELALHRLPELFGHETVWAVVFSRWPPSRIWAFVSVTNDETQQVTTITPQ